MQKIWDGVKRVWHAYTGWLAAHPSTTGAIIIVLAILGLR